MAVIVLITKYNNYITKVFGVLEKMKSEHNTSFDQKHPKSKLGQKTLNTINKPLKSPSPDKKASNLIPQTKSPGVHQLKKNITPIKQQPTALKILQKIEYRQKLFTTDISSKTDVEMNSDAQEQNKQRITNHIESFNHRDGDHSQKQQAKSKSITHSSSKNHRRYSQLPSQFELRRSSRIKQSIHSNSGELDYLRLLKQKEETIKELRDILDMIENNNRNQSYEDDRIKILQRKLKEYSKQIKILQIENQCLISVIQNNHVNLPSNKQQILQREIRELRESLALSEHHNGQSKQNLRKRVAQMESENKNLQKQCERLLKILKDKDNNKKQSHTPHSLISKDKEKLTLSKIKDLYNQNLRLAKENFQNEYYDCYSKFLRIIEKESKKIENMALKISDLEKKLKQVTVNKPITKKSPPKYQQIESLLQEKYSKYLKQLQQQKKVNEKLNLQLSIAWKSIRQLQMKSFNTSQDFSGESHIQQLNDYKFNNSSSLSKRDNEVKSATLKDDILALRLAKDNQIHTLQEKIQTIIKVYQETINERNNLITIKDEEIRNMQMKFVARQTKLKEEQEEKLQILEQKIQQIIKTYEKQAVIYKENISQKNKIIENLKQDNQNLRFQLDSLSSRSKQTETSKITQCQKQIQSLQCSLQKIKVQNIEKQIEIEKFRKQNGNLMEQILAFKQAQISQALLQQSLKESKQKLQQLYERMKNSKEIQQNLFKVSQQLNNKQLQIVNLKLKINDLQTQIGKKSQSLKILEQIRYRVGSNNLEGQLNFLKNKIIDFVSKYNSESEEKAIQNLYTVQSLYEGKIDQNMKLQQEIMNLKDGINRELREKVRMNEKIINLQKNIACYEHELKQRKTLYEILLKEKCRIEKEIVLSKKLKEGHSELDKKTKINITQITNQIDKLVELQMNRSKSFNKFILKQEDCN